MDEKGLNKYCQFIRIIMGLINEHFENQKEYVHCKEGCALCCKNGEYPCSQAEFEFIKIGFLSLDKNLQQKIINKVLQLKAEKSIFQGKKFIHECPFLIDDRCSIYKFRMIICRTFGLAYYDENKEQNKKNTIKVPFCMEQGLNYSEVFDPINKIFSTEKFKATGYKNEPVVYNLGVENLKNKFGKEVMSLDFGDTKPLLDWL